MDTNYLKKDLVKLLLLAAFVTLIIVGTAVWNGKTGILDQLAQGFIN